MEHNEVFENVPANRVQADRAFDIVASELDISRQILCDGTSQVQVPDAHLAGLASIKRNAFVAVSSSLLLSFWQPSAKMKMKMIESFFDILNINMREQRFNEIGK
ncbi:hypothetical protein [Leptospira sp. GIMC2001]|uniref:hypothetical protein n=1 Tax=Leptospira sp. GIMC2001 TaxID=1513297 RepID=UPI00234B9A8E|nr:hypothetical protein [Leptospira sp. GIMC2001]WCL49831.1 hypothetical protein O4O04_03155 [Leptospira sp. GIMC2001]